MRKILLVCALMCSVLLAQARENPKAAEWLKRGDLSFHENKGQILDVRGNTRPDILFTSEINGAKVYFRNEAVSYVFAKVERDLRTQESKITGLHRMDVEFVGANRNVSVTGEMPVGGVTHYYTAANPAGITNVKSYSKITYKNLYDNIDLVFYPASQNGQAGVKYDFVVRPGGRVSDIQLRYVGGDRVALNGSGALEASTSLGSVNEDAPYTYIQGTNQVVASQYLLRNGVVSFRVGNYNANKTLIIDPFTTVASTYYGSVELDQAFGVAVGSNGNTSITGYTQGAAFPVTTGQTTFGGSNDAFIVQFGPNGQRVWATFYGGTSIDQGFGIAVDNQNSVIIAGVTASNSAIATNGTAQSTIGGGSDAFVAKFNGSGIRQWGTYYGGNAVDRANGVAVDAAGDVYAVGLTFSENFSATVGQQVKGAERDAFVLKLNGSNGARAWATLLGGNGTDIANAVTLSGNSVIVAGQTSSSNGIGSIGSFAGGQSDAFVASFAATSGQQTWGAYWGGSGNDAANAVAVAANGDIFVAGSTTSDGLATPGTAQQTRGGQEDGFVGRLNSMGMAQAATYFGGSDLDRVQGIAIGAGGGIFVTGLTRSDNFPTTPNSFTNYAGASTRQGGDEAYIARMTSALTLRTSAFFGGRSADIGRAVATGASNLVVFAGQTISRTDFPTLNAFQGTNAGNDDAFVVWTTSTDDGTPDPCIGFSASAQVAGNTATITVAGGRAPFNFSLNTGQTNTTGVFASLPNGNYEATVTDANNPACRTRVNFSVGIENPCAGFSATATASDATSGNNGSITVFIAGGRAPYTVRVGSQSRTTNASSETFGGLAAGSYEVLVRDAAGCDASRIVIVNQGGAFPYRIREVNNDPNALIVCQSGSVTLVVDNPQGGQFNWFRNGTLVTAGVSNGGSRIVISSPVFTDRNPIVATYNVTGPLGQSNTLTVVFNPDPITTYASGSEGLICSGVGTGTICVTPEPNVTYRWIGPNGQQVDRGSNNCFEVPGPGLWYAILTNTVTGCRDLTIPVNFRVVDGPARPTVTVNGSAQICAGQSVLLSTAPQANVRYEWLLNGQPLPNTNQPSIQVSVEGVYSVRVTSNVTGCAATSTTTLVTVIPTPGATLTASGNLSFCRESDVSVAMSVTAGSGNTYTWRRNGTPVEVTGANTFTARQSGVWDVLVRNSAGCSAFSNTITIEVNSLPQPTILTNGQRLNYCLGENISVLLNSSIVAGNLIYTWTRDGQPGTLPGNGPSIVVNQPGTYRLTITDNTGVCSSVASNEVVITANPIPNNTFVIEDRGPGLPGQDFACEDGEIRLRANTAGASYQWYSNGLPIEGATGQVYAERRVGVFNISLQVSNLGCASSISESRQLTINPKPRAVIRTPSNSRNICVGQSLNLDACDTGLPDPQNLVYRWYLNGVIIPGATSCTFEARVPGIYQVEIVNTRTGCQSLNNVTLELVEPPVPTVTIVGNAPTTFCEGGFVTLQGNPMADAYQWYINNVPVAGQTSRTIQARVTGSYRVELTVGACVVISQPVNVNVIPLPSADITIDGDETFCSGAEVTLIAQPGADMYQWFMSGTRGGQQMPIPGATGQTFRVTERGFYTVMVTKDGCSNMTMEPVDITVNLSPQARIEHPGLNNFVDRCFGATDVVLTAQPPGRLLSYTWLVGNSPETAQVIEGADDATFRPSNYDFHLRPGTYTFWVLISNPQCSTLSAPVQVRYKPTPSVEVTALPQRIVCEEGAVVIIARGFGANPGATYEFTWYRNGVEVVPGVDGDIFGANGDTLYARQTGNFQALVVADNCSGGFSNPIDVLVQPNPSVTVTLTGLENPCVGVTLNVVDEQYLGRPLYKYRWLRNGVEIAGANRSSFTTTLPGNYNVVIVNDITGCEELSRAITVHPNPVANAGPTVQTCVGVPVALLGSASGGDETQYFYSWSGPMGLNFTFSNMNAAQPNVTVNESGTYVFMLSVTDGRGCISNPVGMVSVVVNSNPVANAGPDAAVCQNTPITLNGFATGGTGGPYTFFWVDEDNNLYPGQNVTVTLREAGAETFTLVAIDGNNCEGRDQITIKVNAEPRIIAVDGNPFPNASATFCFGGNLVLQSTATGSFYNWYRDGEFVQGGVDNRYTAFIGGDYTVEVFDGETGISCLSPVPFTVTVNPLPVAVVTPSSGIICPGTPLMLQAGSLPGYSFQWLVGQSPAVAVPAPGVNNQSMYAATMAGRYWVLVTSAEGCQALSEPVDLTMSTLTEVSTLIVQPSGCGTNDGSIFAQYTSGLFPIEYSLNGAPFQFNGFFGNLSAGDYELRIREVGGCTITRIISLTVSGPRNLRVLSNSITDNSATVAWDEITGQGRVRYNLRYRVVGAENWEQTFQGINGTSQVLVGLQHGTTYEVEVQAVCVDVNGIASPWSRVVFQTARTQGVSCSTPTDIYVNIRTAPNGIPTVYWRDGNTAGQTACYDLQYRTVTPLGSWITLQVVNGNNPFPLVDLLPNTTYEVRMRAYCTFCNSLNFSNFSPNIPFTTPGTCDPNAFFTINDGVNEVSNCGDYLLSFDGQVRANYSFQWFVDGIEIGGATEPTFEAQLSGDYDLMVTVGNCDPVFTNRVRVNIAVRPEVIANVQQNVTCLNGTDGVIVAGCVDVPRRPCNLNPFGYAYKIAGPMFESEFQQSGIFTGLMPGQYTVTIRDLETGCEDTYTDPVFTVVSSPEQAQFTSVNGSSVSTAILEWNSVLGANGYILSYRPIGSGEQNWTDVPFTGGCPYPGTCTFVLENLQNNTDYEVRVRTRCALGNVLSDWTDTTSFRTLALRGCGTASPFDAVPGGIFTIVLDQFTTQVFWNSVPGASCYEVRYRQQGQGDDAWVSTPSTPFTTQTLSGLLGNTLYEYEVRSICGQNCSGLAGAWSATRVFRTLFFRSDVSAQVIETNVQVYPNPNNGSFTVSFNAAQEGTVALRLVDLTGRSILNVNHTAVVGSNSLPVEVSQYAAGVYLLEVVQGTAKHVVKVVLN